jgi:hypothetical protein
MAGSSLLYQQWQEGIGDIGVFKVIVVSVVQCS